MALHQFLVQLWELTGIAISLDPWYFAAVQAIGFLPQPQIEAILNAFGQYTEAGRYACGVTYMADDGYLNRSIPQIWMAIPGRECRVIDLAANLGHELEHVRRWLLEGRTTWPGHD